jgi:hypothetical protein
MQNRRTFVAIGNGGTGRAANRRGRGGSVWWQRAAIRRSRRRLNDLREARACRGGAMEIGGVPRYLAAESGQTAASASAQGRVREARARWGGTMEVAMSVVAPGRSMCPLLEDGGEDKVRTWVGPPVIAISRRLDATWRTVVHRIGCDSTNPDPKVACDATSD